jgi:hypothetical protein
MKINLMYTQIKNDITFEEENLKKETRENVLSGNNIYDTTSPPSHTIPISISSQVNKESIQLSPATHLYSSVNMASFKHTNSGLDTTYQTKEIRGDVSNNGITSAEKKSANAVFKKNVRKVINSLKFGKKEDSATTSNHLHVDVNEKEKDEKNTKSTVQSNIGNIVANSNSSKEIKCEENKDDGDNKKFSIMYQNNHAAAIDQNNGNNGQLKKAVSLYSVKNKEDKQYKENSSAAAKEIKETNEKNNEEKIMNSLSTFMSGLNLNNNGEYANEDRDVGIYGNNNGNSSEGILIDMDYKNEKLGETGGDKTEYNKKQELIVDSIFNELTFWCNDIISTSSPSKKKNSKLVADDDTILSYGKHMDLLHLSQNKDNNSANNSANNSMKSKSINSHLYKLGNHIHNTLKENSNEIIDHYLMKDMFNYGHDIDNTSLGSFTKMNGSHDQPILNSNNSVSGERASISSSTEKNVYNIKFVNDQIVNETKTDSISDISTNTSY